MIASSTFECDTIILFLNRAINPTFSTRRGKKIREERDYEESFEGETIREYFHDLVVSRVAPFFLSRRAARRRLCTTFYITILWEKPWPCTTTISASRIKSEVITRSGDPGCARSLARPRARIEGWDEGLKGNEREKSVEKR